MIKRIRFATRRAEVPPADFPAAWTAAVGRVATAPIEVRPTRLAVSVVVPLGGVTDARHDGLSVEWFADERTLTGYEDWLLTVAGQELLHTIAEVADRDRSPVVVADELVMRGEAWLEARWAEGGERLKHVALARRAAGLSPAELSRQWRGEAGRVRTADAHAVTIPDPLLGQAYVQNHPRARSTGEWAYDAINEVYFDEPGRLEERVAWFRDHAPAPGAGLFRDPCFLVAAERALPTG